VWACARRNASRGDQGIFQWHGLKEKDRLRRLVAGEYLKELQELHASGGSLSITKDQMFLLCPVCRNTATRVKRGTGT